MFKKSLSLLLQLLVASGVIFVMLLGLVQFTNVNYPTYSEIILVVLLVVTYFAYLLQVNVLLKYPDFSIHVIIGSLIIRLIVFAAFNFILIYTDRNNAVPNVILFFGAYLVFTVIELWAVFSKIKEAKTTPEQNI